MSASARLVIQRLSPVPRCRFLRRLDHFVNLVGINRDGVIESGQVQAHSAIGPDAGDAGLDPNAVARFNLISHSNYMGRPAI